jgi:DNA repair photolyase
MTDEKKQPKKKCEGDYHSPRITYEFADCSLPITFDQYSNCGYKCSYCFSQYLRGTGAGNKNYFAGKVKAVSVDRIKKIWEGKIKNSGYPWIRERRPIQWGGLSDPFCPLEERYGVGLELLKFFNKVRQPISFSSKSDLLLRDERYFDEFKKAGDLWHYKASIITLDEDKSKLLEAGTPSPMKRVEVLRKLKEAGTLTTWRLRPFVVGVSDVDLEEMVKLAGEVGCQSITTEFFCLEIRASGRKTTQENFIKISKAMGMSVLKFYKENGTGAGYLRLDYNFLKPYVKRYVELAEKHGLKWFISDAKHKEKGCGGSCCGLLPSNEHFKNYARAQMSHLIYLAKAKGVLYYQDYLDAMAENGEAEWRNTAMVKNHLNLKGRASKTNNMSFHDYFHRLWNEGFFEGYFEGVLEVKGKDRNGDNVYFYNFNKAKI